MDELDVLEPATKAKKKKAATSRKKQSRGVETPKQEKLSKGGPSNRKKSTVGSTIKSSKRKSASNAGGADESLKAASNEARTMTDKKTSNASPDAKAQVAEKTSGSTGGDELTAPVLTDAVKVEANGQPVEHTSSTNSSAGGVVSDKQGTADVVKAPTVEHHVGENKKKSKATKARKPRARKKKAEPLKEVLIDDREINFLGYCVKMGLRGLKPTVFNRLTPTMVKRLYCSLGGLSIPTPSDVKITRARTNLPIKGRIITPEGASATAALMHIHGGGYEIGAVGASEKLVANLAKAINCTAYLPLYRLSPGHPYPAGIDDCFASYQSLLEQYGPENLFISGDSAGAGMVISVLARARALDMPMPKKVVLFSPWTDLALLGESIKTHRHRDPIMSKSSLESAARHYAMGRRFGRLDKEYLKKISPINESFEGFPPILIQVGSEEILLSDATALAKSLEQAKVSARLEVWKGLWHCWHYYGFLPEARAAYDNVAAFIGYQS